MNSRIFWLFMPLPWFMVGVFIWLLASPVGAPAGNPIFIVNSTADETDAVPGDGVCETANNVCTLRAAIQESNALSGTDTIELPAGTYMLTIFGMDENAAATGDLDITESVIIQGAGRDTTTVDAADLDRVFHLLLPADETAQLSGLTIQQGDPDFSTGGGIFVETGRLSLEDARLVDNFSGQGGGLYNGGVVTITNTIIQDNIGPQGGGIFSAENSTLTIRESQIITNGAGHGGGLYLNQDIIFGNAPAVEIISTTIAYNGATFGGGMYVNSSRLMLVGSRVEGNGSAGAGGGIYAASALMTVTKTTIADNYVNSAQGDGAGISANGTNLAIDESTFHHNVIEGVNSHGGGLHIFGWSTIVNSTFSHNEAGRGGAIRFGIGTHAITNTTITSNTAFFGGGIYDDPIYAGAARLHNTIVALSSLANCTYSGDIISTGHNLESGDSCNFNALGDLVNTDPLLGPLQDNGGPTWTHALTAGSPAVDAGGNDRCPATDQRGVVRPVDGDGDNDPVCDIGAYEFDGQPGPTPTPTATTPATSTPMVTPTPIPSQTSTPAPSATPTLVPTATPTKEPPQWKLYLPAIIDSALE